MSRSLRCGIGWHWWSEQYDGKLTTLGDRHRCRHCYRCQKKQWRLSTSVDWEDGKDPDPFGMPPQPDPLPPYPIGSTGPLTGSVSSQLAAGISLNQQMNAGMQTGTSDTGIVTMVLRVKKTTRCVWFDAEGKVLRESDEVVPTGLTADEQGRPA